jgi:hypothetical protein
MEDLQAQNQMLMDMLNYLHVHGKGEQCVHCEQSTQDTLSPAPTPLVTF